MTSAAATERCPVCAKDVPDGAARCPNCSAPLGLLPPCPHCRGQGGVSPDAEFRYRCDLCGGPRVPTGAFKSSGRENAALRTADAARKARAGWRALSVGTGLFFPVLAVVFLALTLIFGPSISLTLTALVFTAPVALLFAFAFSKARSRSREIPNAIDEAWVSVANEVAAEKHGAIAAAELAKRLGIEERVAEELLAMIDVNALVSTPAPARVPGPRVTEIADPALDAHAEEEAEAEAMPPTHTSEQKR